MALCCSNCGEEKLRDEARFCDRCGATLVEPVGVKELLSVQQAAPIVALEEDGVTSLLSVPEPLNEERTTLLPVTEPADGLTRFIPQADTTDKPVHLSGSTKPHAPGTAPAYAPVPFQPGYLLQERYRVEQILGQGGFGAAFLAEDVKLERRCVVKRMMIPEAPVKEVQVYQANFEREAKLLAELNDPGHPNIPEIYDYFSTESGNYLVMKYIEGRNLSDILVDSGGKIAWRQAMEYLVEICGALNYMHTQKREPTMHRDIKPANILVGEDRRVWLVDFGLAKADPVEGGSNIEETLSAGSLGYTPLEQWMGQPVPASDIYALGVTLHYLITGINPREPYQGEATIEKVEELHGSLQPIRAVDPSLPVYLEEIISRATATDPNDRPTALQLQQQILAITAGAQVVPLFTFRNGQSAQAVKDLVDLCDEHRQEATRYLYRGDFERWFLLINRNDLAAAANQAVKQNPSQKEGLDKFLKLILPNLTRRRLGRTAWRLTVQATQIILTAMVVILFVIIAGSYGLSWFAQRSIGKTNWDFNTLELEQENSFTEPFMSEKMAFLIGAYLDKPQIEVYAPDQVALKGFLARIPLTISARLQLDDKKPALFVNEVNDIPLFWFGENISAGINNGLREAFDAGPVDVTQLAVQDGQIVFTIEDSVDPQRPPFATATPTPSPTPTPTPSPTPVPVTLVVVTNDLEETVILEVISETWAKTFDMDANTDRILEPPSGTYRYTVRYKSDGQVAAQGVREWVLNKAYRLRIDLSGQQQ